mgnify:CR=1 FL=1
MGTLWFVICDLLVLMLQVNKRLDVAMSNKHNGYAGKEIEVLSAAETAACQKHDNVTYYKGQ